MRAEETPALNAQINNNDESQVAIISSFSVTSAKLATTLRPVKYTLAAGVTKSSAS